MEIEFGNFFDVITKMTEKSYQEAEKEGIAIRDAKIVKDITKIVCDLINDMTIIGDDEEMRRRIYALQKGVQWMMGLSIAMCSGNNLNKEVMWDYFHKMNEGAEVVAGFMHQAMLRHQGLVKDQSKETMN